MLRKKTALTIGILLIVCIFLVISPHSASAQKLAIGVKTLDYHIAHATRKAYEFFGKQGMQVTDSEGKSKKQIPPKIIFGAKQNMSCAIALYDSGRVGLERTIAFIAVASNNRDLAREMRDMIMKHMMTPPRVPDAIHIGK